MVLWKHGFVEEEEEKVEVTDEADVFEDEYAEGEN